MTKNGDKATVQMVYELVDDKTKSLYRAIAKLHDKVQEIKDEQAKRINEIEDLGKKNEQDIKTIYKVATFVGGVAGLLVNAVIDFFRGGGR